MTDLPVRWGDGSFKKWGNPSNGGDDFEMGGGVGTPLRTMKKMSTGIPATFKINAWNADCLT